MVSNDEVWKPVVGYEDAYKVSNMGRILSLSRLVKRKCGSYSRLKAKILGLHKTADGYITVYLYRDSISKTRFVHAVVLEAFVGLRPVGMECRHLDGNKENNALTNIVWGTSLENSADSRRHGTNCTPNREGENASNSKLTEGDIREIRRLNKLGVSQGKLAKRYGVSQPAISYIVRGRNWASVK